jgi:hypothetical protein
MRKLTDIEVNACRFLAREGGYSLGEFEGPATADLRAIFDTLVKKKRAVSEGFDGSVRYTLTAQGEVDAV